ncbi:MAG: hypothetical protein US49_C0001G0307 [candidate division TM6 bacterium GW2011_GWF2_37_49]|nr:MAG: hypothetical protein US49_C0001G0307 [candidate division TM6 bacterium GW2011_GWF2_37_49]
MGVKKRFLFFMIFSVCSCFYETYPSATTETLQPKPANEQSLLQRCKNYLSTKSKTLQQNFWKMIEHVKKASKFGYRYVHESAFGRSIRVVFAAMRAKENASIASTPEFEKLTSDKPESSTQEPEPKERTHAPEQKAPTKAELDDIKSVFLSEIFERVTGMPEAAGIQLTTNKFGTDFTYIENVQTHELFCCGKITHSTLAKLREDVQVKLIKDEQMKLIKPDDKPSFTIICYTGNNPKNFNQADVCALQAHPENANAVFQLASRFHALEGGTACGGLNVDAEFGFFSGMSQPVQGEYASFSAAPGTIFKMYGYEPINLLAGTPFDHLIDPKQSGGSMPTIDQIVGVPVYYGWTDNLQICFHEGITVVVGQQTKAPTSWKTRGTTEKRQFIPSSSRNRINQIPVASFDWSEINDWPEIKDNDPKIGKLSDITRQMLCGFYEGTLLSAVLHNSRKIFLTAVGAGAFQNDLCVVTGAIANDTNLQIIQKYGLEVILVIHEIDYRRRNHWKSKMKFYADKKMAYAFNEI